MKDKKNINNGFLLIDKPSGPSSHYVVNYLRRISGLKRIGHAGTLDPFASGLLIVALGRGSTKKLGKYIKLNKEYEALLRLGQTTDTFDREGQNVFVYHGAPKSLKEIKRALRVLKKRKTQLPPMFSAKKIKGKRLYKLARQGQEVERKEVSVKISKLKVLSYDWPDLKLKIACSSGTYIRSLAFDLGELLGTGAYLEELRRTKIGTYKIKKAYRLEELNSFNYLKKLKNKP